MARGLPTRQSSRPQIALAAGLRSAGYQEVTNIGTPTRVRQKSEKSSTSKREKKEKSRKADKHEKKDKARKGKHRGAPALTDAPPPAPTPPLSTPEPQSKPKPSSGYRGDEWAAPKVSLSRGARETGVKVEM